MIENPTEEQLRTLKGIIYKITNKINGKIYIGQTIGTFNFRYSACRWHHYTTNHYLKKSATKYGRENFNISLLDININSQEKLNELEKFYIEKYHSSAPDGYNLDTGGKQNKTLNILTKEKQSKSHSKKEYVLISPNGEKITFNNVMKFAKEHNLCPQNIYFILSGRGMTVGGFHLEDVNLNKPRRNGKIYYLKDTNDVVYEIFNLSKFCKSKQLSYGPILDIANKITIESQGFCLPETILPKDENNQFIKYNPNRKYKQIILEKENKEYIINNNIEDFCKINNIFKGDVYALILKHQKTAKGFKLKQLTYLNNTIVNF